MNFLRMTALVLCFAALVAVAICIFTDWNDGLFLPLGLCLSVAANIFHTLADRHGKGRKETAE